LFLDEISGLPRTIQAKLLRVLEHGEFSRLGGESMIRCDVRLFCSTTEDLEALVREQKFRDDLYYRINVLEINVPPLRKHLTDLPVLSESIRVRKSALCGRQVDDFSNTVMDQMSRYSWPGNVRELENIIERAVVLANDTVIETLPSLQHVAVHALTDDALEQWFELLPDSGIRADKALANFEKRLLEEALKRNGNIKARAGRWLGFGDRSKDKMRYLCDKYDLIFEGEHDV
jgi:transcriptional regulator with PAS, ATPase and Fis domain